MSVEDFDEGYKSGFRFGKEIANEKWIDRINQARGAMEYLTRYDHEIQRTNSTVSREMVEIDKVLKILDKLIESEG